MIVNRRTFFVKKGKMDELVALLVDTRRKMKQPSNARISYPVFGPFDVVVLETEHKDMQDYENASADMGKEVDMAAFMTKFDELTVPGGSSEIWTLA